MTNNQVEAGGHKSLFDPLFCLTHTKPQSEELAPFRTKSPPHMTALGQTARQNLKVTAKSSSHPLKK